MRYVNRVFGVPSEMDGARIVGVGTAEAIAVTVF
jgi:hypothetical protein